MKKCVYYLFFFCVLSCSKKEQPLKQKTELTTFARESASKPSYEEVRESYSLLGDDEKKDLWLTKYNHILNSDVLTSNQRNIINEIRDLLLSQSMSFFRTNPEICNNWEIQNKQRLESNFSIEQILLLTECSYYRESFSINNAHNILLSLFETPIDDNPIGTSEKNCSCRSSYYCTVGNWGTYTACTTGKDNCGRVDKCGFWGNSECTGGC